jgi:hypothetical protein
MSPRPVVARTVQGFCEAYGLAKTKAYALIKSGTIETRKMGRRRFVIEESAQRWFHSLPMFPPMAKCEDQRTSANVSEKRRYQRSSKYREKQRFAG